MRYAVLSQNLDLKYNQEILQCKICQSQQDIHIDHLVLSKHLFEEFMKTRNDIPSKFDENDLNGAKFEPDTI
jgi:hypothetical protein